MKRVGKVTFTYDEMSTQLGLDPRARVIAVHERQWNQVTLIIESNLIPATSRPLPSVIMGKLRERVFGGNRNVLLTEETAREAMRGLIKNRGSLLLDGNSERFIDHVLAVFMNDDDDDDDDESY